MYDAGYKAAEFFTSGYELFLDKNSAKLAGKFTASQASIMLTMTAMEQVNSGFVRSMELFTGASRGVVESSRAIIAGVTGQLGADISNLTGMADGQVKKTIGLLEGFYGEVSNRTVTTAAGLPTTLFQFLPGFQANIQQTRDAVLTNSQVAFRATQDMSKETLTDMSLFARGFALSSADTTNFVLRDMERTGKASGDTMKEVIAAAFAAQEQLGAAPRIVADQIKIMMNDVDRFGNSTTAQLTVASKQLQELGISVSSLTGLVGAFSNLDGAISKANDLAAVFGVQLDAMEAMYLAAEDPTRLLETIREQMLEQGVDVENMSQSQMRSLAASLGMNVADVKRYLKGDLVTAYDEALGQIEAGIQENLSDTEELAGKAAKLASDGSALTEEQAREAQAAQLAASRVSAAIAETAARANQSIRGMNAALVESQQKSYKEALDASKSYLDDFTAYAQDFTRDIVIPTADEFMSKVGALQRGLADGAGLTTGAPVVPGAAGAPAAPAAPTAAAPTPAPSLTPAPAPTPVPVPPPAAPLPPPPTATAPLPAPGPAPAGQIQLSSETAKTLADAIVAALGTAPLNANVNMRLTVDAAGKLVVVPDGAVPVVSATP
jgi:hypothetical protein